MKKLLVLLALSTNLYAQQIQPLPEIFQLTRTLKCSKVEILMDYLKENFGETLSWVGKDENNGSYLAIFKNKDTGTWSLIQYDVSVGCFIGSGTQGSPI